MLIPLAINILTVRNPHHQNHHLLLINLIHHPVIPNPDPAQAGKLALQRFSQPWICRELIYGSNDTYAIRFVDAFEFLERTGLDFDLHYL